MDHPGNVRLSYQEKPDGRLAIVEENNYYPFGLRHTYYNDNLTGNKENNYHYKYQGQERQDELGLNWDSFKWRNYDYALGRFMSIDPLAEEYVHNGVYNFSENRVIDAVELEGLEAKLLKTLYDYGKKGINYLAKDSKGALKPVSRKSAVKTLQNKGTVYTTGNAKSAKNLMKEATNKKIVRHDGHKLKDGTTGLKHFQKKSGDGSHVNYGANEVSIPLVPIVMVNEISEENSEEESITSKIISFIGELALDSSFLLSPTMLNGSEQEWLDQRNKERSDNIVLINKKEEKSDENKQNSQVE